MLLPASSISALPARRDYDAAGSGIVSVGVARISLITTSRRALIGRKASRGYYWGYMASCAFAIP